MRFHRSELMFLGFMLLLGASSALAYLTSSEFGIIIGAMPDGSMTAALQRTQLMLSTLFIVLMCSVIFGLVVIYPRIRRHAREQGRLEEVTQNLTAKNETFQHAALTDPLTGLQNRRYFDDALSQYLDEFKRIKHPVGLIVLDLDHFKRVNDTYGHDVGDEVLRGLTRCLMDYTRFHDVVARTGGEEFAILAPSLDERALLRLAERIRLAISELVFHSDNITFRVTSSLGIAMWDGVESPQAFIKRADKNLYAAKSSGRNRVVA